MSNFHSGKIATILKGLKRAPHHSDRVIVFNSKVPEICVKPGVSCDRESGLYRELFLLLFFSRDRVLTEKREASGFIYAVGRS